MKKRKIIASIVVLVLIFSFVGCGEPNTKNCSEKIDKALDKSLELKSGSIETEILEGSYYPKNAPTKITAEFTNLEEKKNKDIRNIQFSVSFYYQDKIDEVNNKTNYEGLYLNLYYPYNNYNKINLDKVDKIVSKESKQGRLYYVYYDGSHFSRREEWNDCKVIKDYEYFFIDKNGVITEYTSDTIYKKKDKTTGNWIDGKSRVSVKLTDYETY